MAVAVARSARKAKHPFSGMSALAWLRQQVREQAAAKYAWAVSVVADDSANGWDALEAGQLLDGKSCRNCGWPEGHSAACQLIRLTETYQRMGKRS